MKKILYGTLLCATALVAASCAKTEEKGSGINYDIMDLTVNPGDDFAKYAAGNWTKISPKPADQANWTAFNYINQKNSELIGDLIKGIAAQENEPGSLKQKVSDVYNMVMDSVRLNAEGLEPVKPYLEELEAVCDVESYVKAAAKLNKAGIGGEDMDFICDPKGALLCYATSAPAIDEPSAGYIFTWDMLGNGQHVAFDQYEGEKGTHSEFIEGLMSCDMKKTCDDLAIYFKSCV